MSTKILSGPHFTRRKAQERERQWQAFFDREDFKPDARITPPTWARGAKVEKAGWFQWVVIATSNRGH